MLLYGNYAISKEDSMGEYFRMYEAGEWQKLAVYCRDQAHLAYKNGNELHVWWWLTRVREAEAKARR